MNMELFSNTLWLCSAICIAWYILGFGISFLVPIENKLNFKLYIFDTLYFLVIVPVIFLFTNNINLILSMLIFGIVAIVGEYTFSYCFHKLCGFKLYEYARGNIFAYTSYLNFPFYCGGFLFIFVLNTLILNVFGSPVTAEYSFASTTDIYTITFSLTALTLIILAGFSLMFPAKDKEGRKIKPYSDIIMSTLLYVIVVMGITKDLNIFILFVANFACTWIGEVLLGLSVESGTGYKHWKYNKFSVFREYTSPLIFPLWGLAGVLVYYLMVVFR